MTQLEVVNAGDTAISRNKRRLPLSFQMLWSVAGFALLVVLWQAVASFGNYSEILLPSPLAVAQDMLQERAILMKHTFVTLQEIVEGFALSMLVGLPIAFAIAFSAPLSKLLMPVLVVMNSVPKVAVAPLFLIWLGFGQTMNVILAVLVAVFPIVINAALGLAHLDGDLVRLGRMMGGNGWRIFYHIRLPAALPSIFAGLKVGMTLATIGVVVGEMIAGQEGIGYLCQYAASQLHTVMTFSCIVAMSLLGVALFYTVALFEYLLAGPPRSMRS